MINSDKISVFFDSSGSMQELGRTHLLRNIYYSIRFFFEENYPDTDCSYYGINEKSYEIKESTKFSLKLESKINWKVLLDEVAALEKENVLALLVSDLSVDTSNMRESMYFDALKSKANLRIIEISDYYEKDSPYANSSNFLTLLEDIFEENIPLKDIPYDIGDALKEML